MLPPAAFARQASVQGCYKAIVLQIGAFLLHLPPHTQSNLYRGPELSSFRPIAAEADKGQMFMTQGF